MHNKVVYQAAKALHQRGAAVLRFNFRGAGQSEGAHDRGIGEQADVRTALDYLSAEFPGKPIVLAGFSFGSWVGLRVGCEDARVTRLIGLGLPVDNLGIDFELSALLRQAQAGHPRWPGPIRLASECRGLFRNNSRAQAPRNC